MEESILEGLGNMGVVPIVIFITQAIKKKFGDFKYGSDALAAILSFTLCVGWEFYYMTAEAYAAWCALSGLGFFQWGVLTTGKGFMTWMTASKVYDLGHGNKKREKAVVEEKKELEEQIIVLKNGNSNGENHDEVVEEDALSSKLREILEEGR
jgi:hypothetical protein